MDGYARKRSGDDLGLSRRGSNLSLQGTNHENKGMQNCNRLGCSTRLNSTKGTNIGSLEKPKFLKVSVRSTSSKTVVGSSSKTFSSPTDFRKSEPEKQIRKPFRDRAENSSKQKMTEDIKSNGQQRKSEPSEVPNESEDTDGPSRIETKAITSKPQKQICRPLGPSTQDTPSSSVLIARRSVASRNMGHVTKPCSYPGSGQSRYGMKNLGCSSISDVLPSGCSSSNLSNSRKVNSVRNRPSLGESSSSSGGKSSTGSSSNSFSASKGSVIPQQGCKRNKGRATSRDGPASVTTRRGSGDSRTSSSEQQNNGNVPISETIIYPQIPVPHSQLSILESVPESSSRSVPLEVPPIFHNSFGGRPSSSSRTARSRLHSSHLSDSSRTGLLGDRDDYRRFNAQGIAEVLLALERIEQDDELTYEQLMVLETNLLLGGLSFHDQHRDMRMDIDNMTYEELLALEEKMGTVSTALSEEAISRSLRKSIYIPVSHSPGISASGDFDTKCSICQEEYVAGEDLAKMACDHPYHVDCINQWLRQKNWCPICKKPAASSSDEGKS